MIPNTKSFCVLKQQVQEVIDFSVLCCTAVPSMKGYIKAVENGVAGKIPDPDYYKGQPNYDQLKGFVPSYRKNLGKLILLSSFSYFEAYFKSLIDEIFEFHGGFESLIDSSLKRQLAHMSFIDTEPAKTAVRKLKEYPKRNKKQKYEKYAKELENSEFRFPSELMSAFGLKELHSRYKDMKSVEIPYFVIWCFGVSLTNDEVDRFHKIRETRNEIAHGKKEYIELKESLAFNQELRSLAMKIDSHIVNHYFVIEPSN